VSPKPVKSAGAGNPVDLYMAELKHARKADVEAVRRLILGAAKGVTEGIKWKAPSFRRAGDPDDFATFRLQPHEAPQLILHRGAKVRHDLPGGMQIDDPTGMLKWAAPDRALVTFGPDIGAQKKALLPILRQWMQQL
jgi:hypothetical protein